MVQSNITDNATELDHMLTSLQKLIVDYVRQGQNSNTNVVEYHSPEELLKLLDLSLPEYSAGVKDTFELIKDTLKYSVNTWNPRFMDKLYASTNPIGVISEVVLAVLNANAHVYHCSPVLSLMEIEVTKATARLLNMGENASGLVCPGGSASNLLAMITARNKLYPSIKTKGYFPRPYSPQSEYGILKVFTSTDSHYSIDKAAQLLGLGLDNIVRVPTDNFGRMDTNELERLLRESADHDETPFFINATSGTTVMGAFDPLDKIVAIGKKYNCWVHADGSLGGSAIFSDNVLKTKDWFNGSELVDSFTINPHKLLGVPLQCSMVLTPHGHQVFAQVNSLKADYLFHGGHNYDLGNGGMGCGRRPDALKFFLAWKYYGKKGLGNRIDKALNTSQEFMIQVKKRKGFKLVKDPCPFLQICFWYIPSNLFQNNDLDEQMIINKWVKDNVYHKNMTIITHTIHQKINQSGVYLVDHAPLNDLPNFFRVVINAPTVDVERDLIHLLDTIEKVGNTIDWKSYVSEY